MNFSDHDIKHLIDRVHEWYDREHPALVRFAERAENGGQIRAASGKFIESFLQNIFDEINGRFGLSIESKVGSTDFLSKQIPYNGHVYELNHIQVDRHISNNNTRIAFIENKTYLDSCYWDRALADFRKIVSALKQNGQNPADMEYIVFSGQDSLDSDTRLAYEGEFFNDTMHFTPGGQGIKPHIFCFLKQKRNSSRPMYKIKYEIDDAVLEDFIKLILSLV